MHRLAKQGVCLYGGVVAGLLAGCDSGPQRYEVSGRVVMNGRPLDDGWIEFHPADEPPQGTKQSGMFSANGEYKISKENGLFAGKYRIFIVGGDGRTAARQNENEPPGPEDKPRAFEKGREQVPPEWNTKSNHLVEVKAEGPNIFDFDVRRTK